MNLFSREDFIFNVKSTLRANYAVSMEHAEDYELYNAISRTIMRTISPYWITDSEKSSHRSAYYLSSEYLLGRSFENNLVNLGIDEDVRLAMKEVGLDFDRIKEVERDAGLGNGGLGRLAACFLDSAATLGYPLHGYGIRYEYGIFKQRFVDGRQVETADDWLKYGDPWSIRRESEKKRIRFEGQEVYAVPYDTPIIGYQSNVINTLRLWRSEPIEKFDFGLFNEQNYDLAMQEKNRAEDISRVLYPNDTRLEGKILRCKQQYFFVSASIQDLVSKHKRKYTDLKSFAERNVLQLNDTHPAVAVAELVRILLDEEGFPFEEALDIAQHTFHYTNHTILSEALEKWDYALYRSILPRIVEIIHMINETLLSELTKDGLNDMEKDPFRILKDGQIHMANLALYGSGHVNGVAKVHTEILKHDVLTAWYERYPEKFLNKTNGVTQRRFLRLANPKLSHLITELLQDDNWINHLELIDPLQGLAEDENIQERFLAIRRENKEKLAKLIKEKEGIVIDPDSLFDVQIKRLHEYKRQLLNALLIVDTYYKLKNGELKDFVPRTYFFGAKSAPGYYRAKAIILYINKLKELINNDPETNDKLKIVFVTNYNVTYAESLISAADLSEQISTAGKEASGTGNMKFMMNGVPTIGTLDGANIEIVEQAGEENNFIFGLTVEEVKALRPNYRARDYYESVEGLKRAVDSLIDGTVSDGGTGEFAALYHSLLDGSGWETADNYLLLADFDSYRKAHRKVDEVYRDRRLYAKMCLNNLFHSSNFSSDRTIKEYAKEIWNIETVQK
ncbi:glycogen/starch/alpha-glucan phosphorylase [Guggenheimella bovis]